MEQIDAWWLHFWVGMGLCFVLTAIIIILCVNGYPARNKRVVIRLIFSNDCPDVYEAVYYESLNCGFFIVILLGLLKEVYDCFVAVFFKMSMLAYIKSNWLDSLGDLIMTVLGALVVYVAMWKFHQLTLYVIAKIRKQP